MKPRSNLFAAVCLPLCLLSFSSRAADPATPPAQPLIDLAAAGAEARFKPSSDEVTVSGNQDAPGVVVTIAPGTEAYPGVSLKPETGVWDLSAYGHVEARVVNTGEAAISISLRVDNKSDGKESNTETDVLNPGASGAVKVIFGHTFGGKPGYPLRPSEVQNILLFTGKKEVEQSFLIESIQAGGLAGEKPPIAPHAIRIIPKDGVLLGGDEAIDAAKQIDTAGGAQASVEGRTLRINFPGGKDRQVVAVKPPAGRWNLRDALEVKIRLKNEGQTPANPKALVTSDGGSTDIATTPAPLAPGAEGEITVSFLPATPWLGVENLEKTSKGQPGTGTRFTSNTVSAVKIVGEPSDEAQSLVVSSVTAGVPPTPELPDWLGRRPPVEGDWVMTFQEEFEGDAIDLTRWSIYGSNFWDKRSHFSKDNVILGDGVVKLRFEKKTGFQNDDPSHKQTDYATGFLNTYGKWVQRYGYFEARMKLPAAPGLWPAFWLMPDRGVDAGPQWKRANTAEGGMEFDIMEYLTRWGPNRYNIAMHWDGYDKEHKVTGSTSIYFQPDKDGFITAGLLWTPGLAVFYANGNEVARLESPRISNVESEIIFTNVSGGWDNDPLDDAKLPDDFVIDYVRVWQRKDLASEVDGMQTAPEPSAD